MKEKKLIMKCCICGREKTDEGWQYRYRADDGNTICSHGFCSPCYETEMLKMKLQTALSTNDALSIG